MILFVLLAPLGTVVADWNLDEVLAHADSVVVGTVESQRVVAAAMPLTETTVRIERVLRGEVTDRLVVTQLGGGDAVVVGSVRLVPGARVLLATARRDGRRRIVGLSLGVWFLDGDRAVQTIEVALARPGGVVVPPPGRRVVSVRDVEAALARLAR